MRKTIALLIALLIIIFCACQKQLETANNQDRVSEETLRELRKEYPYCDDYGSVDQIGIKSMEDIREKNVRAVIVFEPCGGWEFQYMHLQPFEEEVDWVRSTYEGVFLPIHVISVLWKDDSFSQNENLTLYFGADFYAEECRVFEAFVEGEKYVGYVIDLGENAPLANEPDLYVVSKNGAYYLTDEQVIISICSWPGIDECSGMYLNTFKEIIVELFK